MIYCKAIDYVLDGLQFEEWIIENNLYKQGWESNQPINWPKLRIIAWQTWQTTAWWSQTQLQMITQKTKNAHKQSRKQLIDLLIDQKKLLDKAKNACKQIIKNNGLARPTTFAKAKTNQEAINQIVTIIINIADDIKWGTELARSLNQGLNV